jgi:hypothetical protein
MNRLILLIFLLAIFTGVGLFLWLNRPATSVASREPAYRMQLDSLFQEFETSFSSATQKYSDQVIAIGGRYYGFSNGEPPILILSDDQGRMANCRLASSALDPKPQKGDSLVVKGILVGYEDLLGEIQMTRCVLETQP